MRDFSARKLTMAGMMAALVFVLTYLPHWVPAMGYIHLGDGAVFLSAMLLGLPGAVASALGSALADLILAPVYIPATVVIKAAMALIVSALYRHRSNVLTVVSFVLAEAIMVLGYFLYDSLLAHSFAAAASAIPANCIQGAIGVAFGVVCLTVMPRLNSMLK